MIDTLSRDRFIQEATIQLYVSTNPVHDAPDEKAAYAFAEAAAMLAERLARVVFDGVRVERQGLDLIVVIPKTGPISVEGETR